MTVFNLIFKTFVHECIEIANTFTRAFFISHFGPDFVGRSQIGSRDLKVSIREN